MILKLNCYTGEKMSFLEFIVYLTKVGTEKFLIRVVRVCPHRAVAAMLEMLLGTTLWICTVINTPGGISSDA